MDDAETAYLERRAEAELILARIAPHPAAARSHFLLAGYYFDRRYRDQGECAVRILNERPARNGRAPEALCPLRRHVRARPW